MVKNLSKTVILLLIAWIILPTGPTDLFVIPFIIGIIGQTGYMLLSVGLLIYIYNTIEGRDLSAKMKNVKKELRGVI